jgi:hypothetical protein
MLLPFAMIPLQWTQTSDWNEFTSFTKLVTFDDWTVREDSTMLVIGDVVGVMVPMMVRDAGLYLPRGFSASVAPGGWCFLSKDQENGEVHRIQIQALVDYPFQI